MWLICLLSYLGLDDLPLAPIYGASFYKVHAFADVTVLEIGVELEGGGGESVNFFWKNPMANYMGDLLWDLHTPKAGNRQHTQIMHINNQQFRHDLSQQITANVISAAWQFLSALCVCKVHKGSVTDSTQKRADRFCKINAPLAKLNHSCNWPLN